MNADTLARLSDRRLSEAYGRHVARLQALFNRAEVDGPFYLRGIGQTTERADIDPIRWLDGALAELADQVEIATDPLVFRPLCVDYNPYGVHFIDSFFGAEIFYLESSAGWQALPLDRPVGTLSMPDMEANPAWRAAQHLTRRFLDYDLPNVTLGLPTLSSVLNIAVNLYGQNVLLAMLAAPDDVRHDLRIIADVICQVHRWYLEHVPLARMQCIALEGRYQPPGYGQLCGCTTHLISCAAYRDFVAPFDDELLSLYPHGGMIHTCGAHIQHIPVWVEMASLRAVQMNDRAADDLACYFTGLRDDQVLYVNPYAGMPVERILEITGGRRTVIVADRP